MKLKMTIGEWIQHLQLMPQDQEVKVKAQGTKITAEIDEQKNETSEKPKWIPIDEERPEDNVPVLTCDENDFIRVLRRLPETGIVYWTNGYVDYTESMLVAWMPLPAPYREE